MNLLSWQGLLFALAGAVVFNLGRARWWRTSVWLVCNLIFLASLAGSPLALVPFALFLLLGYGCIALRRRGGRLGGVAAILVVLAAFVWLKRYSFIPAVLLPPPIYLTAGLSYVFFRVMSLVIEAGQGGLPQPIRPVAYLNYLLNFPALLSGPIQRWADYRDNRDLALGIGDVGQALWRMLLGASKVLLIAPALHALQAQAIATTLAEGSAPAYAAVVALYPVFLWANFSGFIDLVIGIARLYRLRLPENFDHPFAATNFIEFWSRWHITLSQWLKTYVFSPLLLALMRRVRRGRPRAYAGALAFFVTFFLVGAWHGQTSEFLVFGLLQGGGVAVNKLYQIELAGWLSARRYARLCADPIYRALARGLTFTWFAFTLLWFWSNWSEMGRLGRAVGFTGALAAWMVVLATATLVLAVPDVTRAWTLPLRRVAGSRYLRTACASAMTLAIVASAAVLNLSSPEIVYRNF